MKNWNRPHVLQAVISLGLTVKELSAAEGRSLWSSVESRYLSARRFPLWEHLVGASAFQAEDGWQDICTFVGSNESILFFEPGDDAGMFVVECGEDLRQIIGECPRFVFYVTDRAASFLMCHSDHDHVLGAGDAADWVRIRGQQREQGDA